jgi:hypothetical protein
MHDARLRRLHVGDGFLVPYCKNQLFVNSDITSHYDLQTFFLL